MKKVIAYVHSHWDREWYREFEEFRLRLTEVFEEILNALETGELPYFYFDGQTAALEDFLEIHPEKIRQVKELVKSKKLRIGPFYCSADSFLVSGECLCRNFEIGIKTSKEFGETEFIGYLADTFGHSQSIPYVLKHLNIDKACLWRGLGDKKADLDWNEINVTYLIQGYFQDFLNADWSIEKKAEFLKKYLDKISIKSCGNILLPIGADHLAIPKQLNTQIEQLNKIYKNDYKIKVLTPFEYFKDVKEREKATGEFLDNKLNFILPGVYSSRMYIKQANANSQWLLTRVAEPLQAICHKFYKAKSRQNEIDYAYKMLIKNHAHDSIYGCSTDEVCKDVMNRFKNVDVISHGIIKRAVRDISDDGGKLSVINLSNFKYSGKVFIETEKELPKFLNAVKMSTRKGFTDKKLYNINDIPITEDITNINTYLVDVKNIPAFSLVNLTQKNICSEKYLKTTPSSIENNNVKLEIKNGKVIVTDKKHSKVYKDFISVTDRADIGDSYNFGALKNDKPIKAEIVSYKLQGNNKHRAILKVVYSIDIPIDSSEKGRSKRVNKCRISVDIILYNQAEMLEFKINWLNKSKNHILQIGFNIENKIYTTVTEDLFGTVKRKFDPDYNIYKDVPASRGIELKPNTAPMQRFVCAENTAVFTKGNCEYEINKNTLSITLLRATGIISNPHNPTRGTPAGPPIEIPDMQCIGKNTAEIAIAFENNEKELFRLAEEFYLPCLSLFTDNKEIRFLKTDDNEIIYSVRLDGNIINSRVFLLEKNKIKVRDE